MDAMKNVYFLSDAHLGSRAIPHGRTQERRLVNFLDSVKERAAAVYLLGDMFDFWYEFKLVVPKGYTRFLGKLSELTDRGVEVHFFIGNHDIWCGDYLEKELKKRNFRASTIVLKIRNNDFETATKRRKLSKPSDDHLDFYEVARELFESTHGFLEDGIRLLGVTATDFKKENYQAINLFDY